MNYLRKLIAILSLLTLVNCGSSERVITDEGKVYDVKGSKIENNGVEVSETLSNEEKESINNLIKKKEKTSKVFENQKKELERAITEQKSIQNDARKKQKEFENQLNILESNVQKMQDLRDDYASINRRYNDKKNEFEKLKKEGTLSTNNLKDWEEQLKELNEKVKRAKNEMNKS